MSSKVKYMSKTLAMSVLLTPLMLGSVVPAVNEQSELVYADTTAQSTDSLVPDQALNTAIHTRLGIDQGIPLNKEDLARLTDLGVMGKGVTSLEGLQFATNLTTLAVGFNPNLSDLSPLSNLHKLTSLQASDTGISNATPLASLTNLTDLDLSTTKVTDMSQLATLTGLTRLNVSFNRVVNARPLEALTNLNTLSIYGMGTQDMSSLSNLVKSIKTVYSSIDSTISFESLSSYPYVTGDKTITVKNQAKNADGTPMPLDATNANNLALHAIYNISDDTVTFDVSSNPKYGFLKFKSVLSTNQAGDVETLTNYILKATDGNPGEVKTINKYTVEDTEGNVLKTIDPVQYRVGDVPQFDTSIFHISGYDIDPKQSRYRDNLTDSTLEELMTKYKVSSVSELISAMNAKQTEISSTQAESTPTFRLVFKKDKMPSVAGGEVTVHYQDENGKTLADSQTLNGNVDDDYATNGPVIPGYHLITQPDNTNGKFTTNEQSVVYIYAKDKDQAGVVTVNYQDENGQTLADSQTLNGNVDDDYATNGPVIPGYHLITQPDNTNGKFTTNEQSVVYIYSKDKDQSGKDVTVSYIDEDDKAIAKSIVLSGKIGEYYTSKSITIDGYTLKTKPSNATGEFTGNVQSVKYVYVRNVNQGGAGYNGSSPTESISATKNIATAGSTASETAVATNTKLDPIANSGLTTSSISENRSSPIGDKPVSVSADTLPETGEQNQGLLVTIGLALIGILGVLKIKKAQ